MRKIYPPPFAIFIFYGLLSLAVIASAQDVCGGQKSKLAPIDKRTLVGYYRPGSGMNPTEIKWDSYGYINIVVNDAFPSLEDVYKSVTDARDSLAPDAKVLLSIRDYLIENWNNYDGFYDTSIDRIMGVINTFNLDGLDFEFPGTRLAVCKGWDKGLTGDFVDNFLKKLKNSKGGGDIGKGKLWPKTLMLTVGKNAPIGDLDHVVGDSIDLLNVETYHASLYENPVKTDNRQSYPNNPFNEFSGAFKAWSDKIDKKKIIMGIDFGNTIEIVTNINIETSQTVPYTALPSSYAYINKLPVTSPLTPIDELCFYKSPSQLYRFPWKELSTYLDNFCTPKNNLKRNFDDSTPWLYGKYDEIIAENTAPNAYYYISYEDVSSLTKKLMSIGGTGISISDVSYVDDSLFDLVHENKLPDGLNPSTPGPGKGNTTSTKIPSNTDPANNAASSSNNNSSNKSSIVGGVLGGLMGSILLITAGFLWYRRKNPKTKEVPRGSFGSHTALKNEGEQNQVVQNTVIPVAPGYVTAMFDFTGKEENDLSFRKGDKIEVLEKGDGPNDWWVGRVNGVVGEFPGNYVKET